MNPADIIEGAKVRDRPNFYVLGCFDGRITFYSQQVRALSLVHALHEFGYLNVAPSIAVIGAGAAGLTAAAAAALASEGRVVLFETSASLLPLQSGTTRRKLDPHIYDWPRFDTTEAAANLPILDWEAGSARDVRHAVVLEFENIASRAGGRLEKRTRHPVKQIRQVGTTYEIVYDRLDALPGGGPEESLRDRFDMVFLAIGFGLEPPETIQGIPNASYWSDNGVPPPEFAARPTPRFFISGNGDGGLIDLVAAAASDFDHGAMIRIWQDYLRLQRQVMDKPPEPATTTGKAGAWAGFKTFKIVRRASEDAAESICSFYLVAEDGLPLPAFLPGQYLTFRLDVPTPAGHTQKIVRCYSLSDAPRPDYYRVSIKRIPAPAGSTHPPGRSSNHFHDHLIEGTTLQVRAPAGHFHLDRSDTPVVLLAGGIGITPLLSMLNDRLQTQPEREIWLFYGVRNRREVAMRAHLEQMAVAHPRFHLRFCFSDPLPDDQPGRDFHHQGRVSVALLRMELWIKPYEFYICGPTPMMESLVPALQDWGVPDARIHFEAFGPASIQLGPAASEAAAAALAQQVDAPLVVTFARAGKALPWTSAFSNLLDFAEANGIAVNSGCRAGSCGTCQTAIRSGEVIYRQAPDYDPEPGTCLPCSCVPGTDVTLEA